MSKNDLEVYKPQGEMVIYRTDDGKASIDVVLENETVWLPTSQIAILFGKEESNIRRHIINIFAEGELARENNVHFLHVNNIFEDGELNESLSCAKFAHHKKYGRREGFTKEVESTIYNLDVILAVGYRVRSKRGVEFCAPLRR